MVYLEWAKTYGQNRWYKTDGTPRTFTPLDYNYKTLFDKVCAETDEFFAVYEINDIMSFMAEWTTRVPRAWQIFKTQIEMMLGTLDGSNIDPLVFEAGFDRTTAHTLNNNMSSSADTTANGNASDVKGSMTTTETGTDDYTQSDSNTQRLYNQGAQAYNTDDPLTRDFASTIQNIENTSTRDGNNTRTTEEGQRTDTSTTGANSTAKATQSNAETFTENIKERRINYYDNLAFLRERWDRTKEFKNFYEYFLDLFVNVSSFSLTD